MSDAVIAAAAAILAVAVSGFVSLKLQGHQFEEARKDRRGDVRRDAYASMIQTETRCYHAVLDDETAQVIPLLNDTLETSTGLTLLASQGVIDALKENFEALANICRFYETRRAAMKTPDRFEVFKEPGWRMLADTLDNTKYKLVTEMRKELGAEPLRPGA